MAKTTLSKGPATAGAGNYWSISVDNKPFESGRLTGLLNCISDVKISPATKGGKYE